MGAATIAFGLLACGLVSALLLWSIAAIGCAEAYMPGLRAMTDRLGVGAPFAKHHTLLKPAWPEGREQRILEFRPVLRNRAAMGYVLDYESIASSCMAFGRGSLRFGLTLSPEGELSPAVGN